VKEYGVVRTFLAIQKI